MFDGLPDIDQVVAVPRTWPIQNRMTKSTAEAEQWIECMRGVADRRDREAFMRLFDHFAPRVKAYLIRNGADSGAAEDLAQDVLLTVWRKADRYDPSQAGVGTWIFTIARNRRIDVIRRERRPELDPEDPSLAPSAPQAADESVLQAQQEALVASAIRELPEEQANLIRLAFFEDMTHSEIAAVRDLPLGTVKSRLRLAMGRLRKVLES